MRISDWSSDVCSSDLRLGTLSGTRWAWLGDGNNVLHSIIEAGSLLHFAVRVGCPAGYDPSLDELGRASCRERVCQCVSISGVAGSLRKKKKKCTTDGKT